MKTINKTTYDSAEIRRLSKHVVKWMKCSLLVDAPALLVVERMGSGRANLFSVTTRIADKRITIYLAPPERHFRLNYVGEQIECWQDAFVVMFTWGLYFHYVCRWKRRNRGWRSDAEEYMRRSILMNRVMEVDFDLLLGKVDLPSSI